MGDSDVEGWSTQTAFPGSSNVGVCGENDMDGDGVSAANTFTRMKKVLAKLLGAGVKQVLYMGTKPEPDTTNLHAKYRQYDGLLRAHATALALAATAAATAADTPPFTMVDVYPSFEALGNSNNLYQNDQLHLSSEGYGHWNTWARSALASSVCIRWLSNACVEQLEAANCSQDALNETAVCNKTTIEGDTTTTDTGDPTTAGGDIDSGALRAAPLAAFTYIVMYI